MIGKLFARFRSGSPQAAAPVAPKAADPAEEALLRVIAKESGADPLIGAKVAAKAVTRRLMDAMKTGQGIHVESLLCALGGLAGYACQAATRAAAVSQGLDGATALVRVETADGGILFFGDELNRLLVHARYSVWGVAAGGAQPAGCNDLPDMDEIFEYVAGAVGTPAFGIPRVPEQHRPHDTPVHYVTRWWPELQPILARYCADPGHWPVAVSLSVQEVIVAGKPVLEPGLALRLAMEAAVSMSKIDLAATMPLTAGQAPGR